MRSDFKAKTFQSRMGFKGGKTAAPKGCGCHGMSAGEKAMGNMTKQLTAKEYPNKQSKDGNGGK